ncbi:MAG: RNA methyltransferase, partial [Burkholderiaceae bacterium]|nr:RNA methyltransferase [Burkholderiaceae bacterium]
MSTAPTLITSKDNAFVKDLKRLAQDNTAYRKQGRVWLEGDHLCRAALTRGLTPAVGVFSDSFWASRQDGWEKFAIKNVVLTDALLKEISGLESPAPMGFVLDLPAAPGLAPEAPSVILDRVQDAGNVGSILRSAAAFGFKQIIALKGTAALWSPKVLRAGMGAHFGLQLIEGVEPQALGELSVPILVTSSHQGNLIQQSQLP